MWLFQSQGIVQKPDATTVSIAEEASRELERVLDAYVWMIHSDMTVESLSYIVNAVRKDGPEEHRVADHAVSGWIANKKNSECWSCSQIRAMAVLLSRYKGMHLSWIGITVELTPEEKMWTSTEQRRRRH